MTIAAASHVAAHGAAGAGSQVIPSGNTSEEQQILLLLVLAAVIIFIQHDKSGTTQNGTQYAALGVVGFLLLVLAQFWAELALTFTILFVVSIILNSPNGIPVIGGSTPTPAAGTPNKPGETGFGAAEVPVNQQTGVAQ